VAALSFPVLNDGVCRAFRSKTIRLTVEDGSEAPIISKDMGVVDFILPVSTQLWMVLWLTSNRGGPDLVFSHEYSVIFLISMIQCCKIQIAKTALFLRYLFYR
jgi:hypothetical protein